MITGFHPTRRSVLLSGAALTVTGLVPARVLAADPIKMAGIYTVPVEQQWVSRIHIAAEAAQAAGLGETPRRRQKNATPGGRWPTPGPAFWAGASLGGGSNRLTSRSAVGQRLRKCH